MNHKLVNYWENILSEKFFELFKTSPVHSDSRLTGKHYVTICKILKHTLGDDLQAWEEQHQLLERIAWQIGEKTQKKWLGKVVAELLIDPNFTLVDLKKALTILDQLYLGLASKKNFWNFESKPATAQNIYRFLRNTNLQRRPATRQTPSLTYLDMLTDWQQKNKITDCFQLHRLLSTCLEMFEISTTTIHLQIFYNGKKQWHEQTVFYPNDQDHRFKIFDLSLGENYRQAPDYREFLVEHFNFNELLEYRLSQYYFNKYYLTDPTRGIELINRLNLLYNKKGNLNFLHIRNVFYNQIIYSKQFQKHPQKALLLQATQNARLIWDSFKNYPNFIPEVCDYLSLLNIFGDYIKCSINSADNKEFFYNFAREINLEAKRKSRQMAFLSEKNYYKYYEFSQ